MKKYLFLYAVAVTALFVYAMRHYRYENRRLEQNQTALSSELTHYRTTAGQQAASAQVLRLRCAEFEELRAADAAVIRDLGVKLKRVEASVKTATETVIGLRAALRDTVVVRSRLGGFSADHPASEKSQCREQAARSRGERDEICARAELQSATGSAAADRPAMPEEVRTCSSAPILTDTLRVFRWRDAWVTVEGLIDADSVGCRIRSIDTLRQIVHRIPRRFLFIRWGTKALRQEIVSSNPHTRIVFSEYVKIERETK